MFFAAFGLMGLALPVVPQIQFFLLAVLFFSEASPNFEKKIKSTKIYLKYIEPVSDKLKLKKWIKALSIFLFVVLCVSAVAGGVVWVVKR